MGNEVISPKSPKESDYEPRQPGYRALTLKYAPIPLSEQLGQGTNKILHSICDIVTEPNSKRSHVCPLAVKPIYWHWVVVKESTAFMAGHQAGRMGSSCSKDLNSPVAFREGVLKSVWRRVLQGCGQLVHSSRIGWHQGEVSSIINLLVSTSLGSMFLRSAVFIWWGSTSCKTNLGMCVRPLSISCRELWVQWFCHVADL